MDINNCCMSLHQCVLFVAAATLLSVSSTSRVAAVRNSSLGDFSTRIEESRIRNESTVTETANSDETVFNFEISVNCSSPSDIDLVYCVNMTSSGNLTLSSSAVTATKNRGWLLNEIQMIKAVVLVIVVSILLLSTCTFIFRTSSLFAKSKDDDAV